MMKKNKVGATFLVSILALAGIGITYAGFSDTIHVYGTVNTAEVDLVLEDFSCTYVWKVWEITGTTEPQWPDGLTFDSGLELAVYHGPCIIEIPDSTTEPAKEYIEDLFDDYCQYEFQSHATAEQGDEDDTIIMDYYNLFPCIDFIADFIVHYTGTIPVKVDVAEIFSQDQWLQDLWALHEANPSSGYGAWVEAYLWDETTNDFKLDDNDERIPVNIGYQLHNCQYVWVGLVIHLPQNNDLQGLSGTFEGKVSVIQWYDTECPCETPYFTEIDLEYSTDQDTWSDAGTNTGGFVINLDDTYDWFYLTLGDTTTTNVELAPGYYPFYVNTYPEGYFAWWDGRGVNADATGYQAHLWKIINSNEPMFYVKVDSDQNFQLIDGLLQDYFSQTDPYLRVNGDYYPGYYTYKGYVTASCGYISDPIIVGITFQQATS